MLCDISECDYNVMINNDVTLAYKLKILLVGPKYMCGNAWS